MSRTASSPLRPVCFSATWLQASSADFHVALCLSGAVPKLSLIVLQHRRTPLGSCSGFGATDAAAETTADGSGAACTALGATFGTAISARGCSGGDTGATVCPSHPLHPLHPDNPTAKLTNTPTRGLGRRAPKATQSPKWKGAEGDPKPQMLNWRTPDKFVLHAASIPYFTSLPNKNCYCRHHRESRSDPQKCSIFRKGSASVLAHDASRDGGTWLDRARRAPRQW
jgi:hypothetical protein